MTITRRKFIGACAGACALNGVTVTLGNRAYAKSKDPHYLIYVFLNGGMDGLNFLAPESGIARANYNMARPSLQVPPSGQYKIIPLSGAMSKEDKLNPDKGGWGLNRAAERLMNFWGKNSDKDPNLAFIHSTGPISEFSSRSHFEATDYIQRGTTRDYPGVNTGWVARHLNSIDDILNHQLHKAPLLSIGGNPGSSVGFDKRVAVPGDFKSFKYYLNSNAHDGAGQYLQSMNKFLREVYQHDGMKLDMGINTVLDVMDSLGGIATRELEKFPNNYPKEYKGQGYASIARDFNKAAHLITQADGMGVEAITVNYGGWDTHGRQGPGGEKVGYFNEKIDMLVGSIDAFHQELVAAGKGDQYTIVMQTEFGRRLRENGNGGSDHGTASPMVVIGNKVKSGLYGQSSTLSSNSNPNNRSKDDLHAGVDVPILTDYRKVLYEILGKGFGRSTADLAEIFPNFDAPSESELLGFMNGRIKNEPVKPTDPDDACNPKTLFADSFE